MLEVAAREQEAGRITHIWSNDKYFDPHRSCAITPMSIGR